MPSVAISLILHCCPPGRALMGISWVCVVTFASSPVHVVPLSLLYSRA